MEKFIPYEKLSKKKKRELEKARRGTWGEQSPVTRKAQSAKVYDRNKARKKIFDDSSFVLCFICNNIH